MIRYIINRNGSGKNIKYETWYAPHSSYRDVWSSNYASHRNEWAHIYMLYDKLDQLSHCHTWSRLKDGNQPLYICENDNIKISPLNTCFCFPVIRFKRKYNGKSDNFPVVVITDYRLTLIYLFVGFGLIAELLATLPSTCSCWSIARGVTFAYKNTPIIIRLQFKEMIVCLNSPDSETEGYRTFEDISS